MVHKTLRHRPARLSSGSSRPPKRVIVGKRRRPTGPNAPQTGGRGPRPEAPTRDDRTPSRGDRAPSIPQRDDGESVGE
jgi:hypothetical protein